ncbi:hypothetical protein D8M04_16225 [Oceanobacillus piezotolerans]|uniref:Spore coat protein n=1 Tax=Oceanobacillus piezotolerans TaxID=2448030 RepID=A0A498D639_9BACI|nr:YppG family protein [Oceanobacillus piezotolerans]RLL42125.1 hypothetical protein D8M04_16225 [Oceanobacillus piezotolerans]
MDPRYFYRQSYFQPNFPFHDIPNGQQSFPPFGPNGNPYPMGNPNLNNQSPFDYFQKPDLPMNWPNVPQASEQSNVPNPQGGQQPFQQGNMQQQPPNNMMGSFQKDGQFDLDKMLSTVGQFANTYHQVAPIIQQLNGFLKAFRS